MKKNDKSKPLVIIQCYEDRQSSVPLRKVTNEPKLSNGHASPKKEIAADSPPPPPPMPKNNSIENGVGIETTIISKIQPIKPEDLNGVQLRNGNIRTPTPDYNKNNIINGKVNGYKNNKVEQESEFKTKHASLMQTKSANYFSKETNGQATMKKLLRPVSVTIGEYNGDGGRKQPSKLDFLNGDMVDGSPDDMPLTNRLQSELALTLSRSNLRRKTDTLIDNGR